jgi:hypothetical protein
MHIPHISQRHDALLHQISQILDHRTWTTATVVCTHHAVAGADKWQEQNRPGIQVAAPTACVAAAAAVAVKSATRYANRRIPFVRSVRGSRCVRGCRTRDRG